MLQASETDGLLEFHHDGVVPRKLGRKPLFWLTALFGRRGNRVLQFKNTRPSLVNLLHVLVVRPLVATLRVDVREGSFWASHDAVVVLLPGAVIVVETVLAEIGRGIR